MNGRQQEDSTDLEVRAGLRLAAPVPSRLPYLLCPRRPQTLVQLLFRHCALALRHEQQELHRGRTDRIEPPFVPAVGAAILARSLSNCATPALVARRR
jgi:hypothetical protein